jgi:hypothetical protein
MIAGYGSDGFLMEDVAFMEGSDGWAGLGWGEAFEVSRHSSRTIPFDSMSFADNRIVDGVEELTHVTSNAVWRKVDGCSCNLWSGCSAELTGVCVPRLAGEIAPLLRARRYKFLVTRRDVEISSFPSPNRNQGTESNYEIRACVRWCDQRRGEGKSVEIVVVTARLMQICRAL